MFFKSDRGGVSRNHFLGVFDFLALMICSPYCIIPPCILFFHYASFRSVGVRSINRGIVTDVHWKYIHTIYIFDICSFSGKLFYHYICGTFLLPTTLATPHTQLLHSKYWVSKCQSALALHNYHSCEVRAQVNWIYETLYVTMALDWSRIGWATLWHKVFHIWHLLKHEPHNSNGYVEREPIETMKLNISSAKVVSREVESDVVKSRLTIMSFELSIGSRST